LEGSSSFLTNGTNPLEIILKGSFRSIKKYGPGKHAIFQNDTDILAGDFVSLNSSFKAEASYIHSGRIIKINNTNWIVSKFGEGPLLVNPLSTIEKEFWNQFFEVEVFRFKK